MNDFETLAPGAAAEDTLSMEQAAQAQKKMKQIVANIETVITGKREQVEFVVMCMWLAVMFSLRIYRAPERQRWYRLWQKPFPAITRGSSLRRTLCPQMYPDSPFIIRKAESLSSGRRCHEQYCSGG